MEIKLLIIGTIITILSVIATVAFFLGKNTHDKEKNDMAEDLRITKETLKKTEAELEFKSQYLTMYMSMFPEKKKGEPSPP